MIKNKEEFVLGLSTRKIESVSTVCAQMLKNERLRRKMTLEEASRDICSVSYLCKLENSQIKTNDDYVKALCDRYSISYNTLSEATTINYVDEVIKDVFLGKENEIELLYEKVENLGFSSNIQIVKCFYYLQKSDFKMFEDGIKALDDIKFTLNETEGVTLIYLVILYNMMKFNYNEAYRYLKLLDLVKVSNKKLHYLILEASIEIAYYTKNACRLFISYDEYEKIDYVGYPLARKIVTKMIYNAFICNEYPNDVLDDVNLIDFNDIPSNARLEVAYFVTLIKIRRGNLFKIFKDIVDKTYYLDARFLGIMAYICYKLNSTALYKELLKIVEGYAFSNNDSIHQKFVCFMLLYVSSKDKDDLIKYMKEQINPYLYEEVIPLYNEVYKNIYLEYMSGTSKYKESYYYLKRYYE